MSSAPPPFVITTTAKEAGTSELPADMQRALAPATHALYEWTDYWVEAAGADTLRIGDRDIKPLRPGLFPVRFENQLGLTTIQAYTGHRPLAKPLVVEVLSRKFPDPATHIQFVRALLNDLFARAARLPFTFSAPTSRSVIEATHPPSVLFAFHFLCQEALALRAALGVVQAAPHRVLADSPTYVPLHEAADVDAETVTGILHTPDALVPARSLPFAARLKQRAPERVWQRRPEETFDTPENRFVLAFLGALLAAAESVPAQPWWKHVPPQRQHLIRELAGLLRQAMAHPMFDTVGALHQVPSASQVLLRRAGYRELRELWQLFHRARRPLFAPLQRAIELRDIARLYEMWAFFALAEEIGRVCSAAPTLELQLSDTDGLGWKAQAHIANTGLLVYNAYQPSYSVPLRPDYAWVHDSRVEVVFDAKFRVDRKLLDEVQASATTLGTAKVADIYKMHTYRDALRVRAAVILYPGDVSMFYNHTTSRRDTVTLHDLLFGNLAGIGAIPLRPDTQRSALA